MIWAWLGRAVPGEFAVSGGGPVRDGTGGEGAWDRPGPGNRAWRAAPVAGPVGAGRRPACCAPALPVRPSRVAQRSLPRRRSPAWRLPMSGFGPGEVKPGPGSRWDPSVGGRACSAGGDDPVEPVLRFVEDHRDSYGVKRLRAGRAGLLVLSAPGESGAPARQRRWAAEAALTELITRTCTGPTWPWARPGPIAELNETAEQAGGRVSRQRVARLMRTVGANRLPATAPGAHHRAGPDRAGARCPNPLGRDVTASGPQPQDASAIFPHCVGGAPPARLWLMGRTCTWPLSSTAHGRRPVGRKLRAHMRNTPWPSRLSSRPRPHAGGPKGAVFHTDHGSPAPPRALHACERPGTTPSGVRGVSDWGFFLPVSR